MRISFTHLQNTLDARYFSATVAATQADLSLLDEVGSNAD